METYSVVFPGTLTQFLIYRTVEKNFDCPKMWKEKYIIVKPIS